MSANAGRSQRSQDNRRRRSSGRPSAAADIWRSPSGVAPPIEPIAMPREVSALLRSLGDPPMTGGTAAGHYFSAVVERSAAIAIALALSADLLEQ